MSTLSGFPYAEIQFTKDGEVHDEQEVTAALELLDDHAVTDLFVVAHGWNNHMAEARTLYGQLFESVRAVLDAGAEPSLDGRSLAVLGILWPSKKFADKDLIPGGAASVGGAAADVALAAQIDELKGGFDDPDADETLEQAKALIARLDESQEARDQYVTLLRGLAPSTAAEGDSADELASLPPAEVLNRLSRPVLLHGNAGGPGAGGAARVEGAGRPPTGGAAGFGDMIGGVKAGAQKLLNLVTYYQMKERAGKVGREGLHPQLRRLLGARPELRLHLIGHSFGGRLMTAAAAGPDGSTTVTATSLSLLQAAFSHHGFAQRYDGRNDGHFRRVVDNRLVTGPILITCTRNDTAVGLLYPIASQLAGHVAAAIGDKNDPYGGIGSNGAQKTPEATDATLLAVGERYELDAGRLYNLVADAHVADHGDVAGREVARAILAAATSTRTG